MGFAKSRFRRRDSACTRPRRSRVLLWRRQVSGADPSLIGPFFSPTRDGWKIDMRCGVQP